jgi:hypothetical protein
MKPIYKKIILLVLPLLVLIGIFFFQTHVSAQVDTGIAQVGTDLGMPDTDIRVIIAKIVRIALGLLGIVALVLILYGGFIWMTAGGNQDRIDQAKKILVNAVIGLVIILSAFAIVSFVINKLAEATSDLPAHCYNGLQDEGETGIDCGGDCNACGGGIMPPGAENVFYVQQKPSGEVCVRNFYPIVVFNKPVNVTTLVNNLIIRRKDTGVVADGMWNYTGAGSQNAVKFSPTGDCGDGTNDCFDPSTTYELFFAGSTNIFSQDNLSLSCNLGMGCATSEFITGEGIDREPPTVTIVYPNEGERLEKGLPVPVDINFTDDNGVQNISLYTDGGFISSQSLSGCQQSGVIQLTWSTTNVSLGNHTLRSTAWDYSAAEANDSVSVNIQPSHCFNGVTDEGEEQIDCGGVCGQCAGSGCTDDAQCASGYCEIPDGASEGVCVDKMQITNVSPLSGAFGTYVTVSGRNFGNDGGAVSFTGDRGTWVVAPVVNCGSGYDNWTGSQIVVSVPEDAIDGPLRVDTALIKGVDGVEREFSDTTLDDWGPHFIYDVNDLIRPKLCGVDPTSGPPYTTTAELSGKDFGGSQDDLVNDSVSFADLKSIITVWSDGLIRTKTPGLSVGAIPLKVVNNGIDSNSIRFYVTDEIDNNTPIIYSITPSHGARGEYVTLTGKNFGNTLGKVILKERGALGGLSLEGSFAFPETCEGAVWTSEQIIFKIPTDADLNQDYSVQVQFPSDPPVMSPLGGYFSVEAGNPSPGICKLSPVSGPIPFAEGQNMTIFGEYFTADNITFPYFWTNNADPNTITGRIRTTEFVSWQNEELVVRPPNETITGPVIVSRDNDHKISNPLSFTALDCTKNNNICTEDGYKCCATGKDAGICRAEGDLCDGETRATGYMWRFSTRDFPSVPRVVENCDATVDAGVGFPSPAPSLQWNAGNNDHSSVCRTAEVTVEFTAELNQATLNNTTVKIYQCGTNADGNGGIKDNRCLFDSNTEVAMTIDSYHLENVSDENGNHFYLEMSPSGISWQDNQWYQVVLSKNIQSVDVGDGVFSLKEDRPCGDGTAYCFVFKTGASDCRIKSVVITPFSYWTSILESPMNYRVIRGNADDPGEDLYYVGHGLSSQHCIYMNTDAFTWVWNTENSNYSRIYAVDSKNPRRAQVTAEANTVGIGLPNDKVGIRATASRNGVDYTTSSPLIIDLSDPEVVEYWPNCLEACTNAEIGARFNIAMSDTNLSQGVKLYKCGNENCSVGNTTVSGINTQFDPADRRHLIITPPGELEPDVIYLVVLSSATTANKQLYSLANKNDVTVAGKAYQKEFAWRFKTKKEKCIIDRVEVIPQVFNAPVVNARAVYSASAYSSPDTCAVNGQRLNAWNIPWNWTSSQPLVAEVQQFITLGKNNFCTTNCLKKGSDILYGETFAEPLCGNNNLEAGEDCLTPNKAGNCSLNCLFINKTNLGSETSVDVSTTTASICGNGRLGAGEDCDIGITPIFTDPKSAMNCSNKCLHTGSVLTARWCTDNLVGFGGFTYEEYTAACAEAISQCGDKIVAPSEDSGCDGSAGYNSVLCSPDCRYLQDKKCTDYTGPGRMEGCSAEQKLTGSSLYYSTPSVCGDGFVGLGENSNCEANMVPSHIFIDPWVLVKGKGNAVASGNPPAQRTDIVAVGTEEGKTASGKGEFVIQCGYSSDSECSGRCGVGVACGVGANTCCYARPNVISTYPEKTIPPQTNICPNTYIEVVFDRKIDKNSLSGNILVAEGNAANNCSTGEDVSHYISLNNIDTNAPWYKKAWTKVVALVKNIFTIGPVNAFKTLINSNSWCAGLTPISYEVVYDPLVKNTDGTMLDEITAVSHVLVNLQQPLSTSSDYAIILLPGIRDINGVSIGGDVRWQFITGNEMCLLDVLTIDPPEYLFSHVDENISLTVKSATKNGQLIQPVNGYKWEYLWSPWENDFVTLALYSTTPPATSPISATARNRSGEVDVVAAVHFLENNFTPDNPQASGLTKLKVYLCENPWPSLDVNFEDTDYDFATFYCMDNGEVGEGDDLPDLKYSVRNTGEVGMEVGALRKYLFYASSTPDAIGIVVLQNTEAQSVYKMLQLPAFQGYQKLTIKGNDAITNGSNIYIDTVIKNGDIYSNIYLFTLSQNAGPEMKKVFDQMIENLDFNIGLENIAYCSNQLQFAKVGSGYQYGKPNYERPCQTDMDCAMYSDTSLCLTHKDKIRRNYKRFKDLRDISVALTDYKAEVGDSGYPAMGKSTYIPGQALSVWTNSWNELGSQVGVLPTDPINKLAPAGSCLHNIGQFCTTNSECVPVGSISNSHITGWWMADNSANDSSVNANHGSIVGDVGFAPGVGIGSAWDFKGTAGSRVVIPHSSVYNVNTSYSVSLWFKPTEQKTAMLFKKGGLGDNGESLGGFEIEYSGLSFAEATGNKTNFNNGTIRFALYRVSNDTQYYAVDYNKPLVLNKWHHIFASRDGGNRMFLYIDGVFVDSAVRRQDGSVVTNPQNTFNEKEIVIGENLTGLIDEVLFYRRSAPPVSGSPPDFVKYLYNMACVPHDPATGWSTADFRFSFACNVNSFAYRYLFKNNDFTLKGKMENDLFLNGNSFINQDSKIVYDSLGICLTGAEISSPNSNVCGDGVIGSGEDCDPSKSIVWDISGCPNGTAIKRTCNSSCHFGSPSNVSCVDAIPGKCGDGKIQFARGEVCDDGNLNGQAWRCKTDCSGIDNAKCGNGVVDAGELCDPGVGKSGKKGWCIGGPYTMDPDVSGSYKGCNYNSECSTNNCFITPIKYSIFQDASCGWDCKSRGSYCGDTLIQSEWGEDCDGDIACILPDGRDGRFSCTDSCRKDNTSGGSTGGDMLALWEFDSIGPNGEIKDTMGNYPGTCKQGECPEIVYGRNVGNPAFDFMGQNRMITINDKDDKTMATPPFSWEVWFKQESSSVGSNLMLMSKGGNDMWYNTSGATGRIGGSEMYFYSSVGSQFNGAYFVDGNVNNTNKLVNHAIIDVWHHLIVAFEPTVEYTPVGLPTDHRCWDGTYYMYVDGNLSDREMFAHFCDTDYPLCFGAKCDYNGNIDKGVYAEAYSFKGAVEDIAFYNKVIDPTTIDDHANSTNGWYCTAYPDDYYDINQNSINYVPYCGNGILDENEVCDMGSKNGVACDPRTNGRCSYCAYSCDKVMMIEYNN